MREEVASALALLEQAIQIEREGRAFYLKAAQATGDEKGRETFAILANDEQNHLNLIQKQAEALTRDNRWASLPEMKSAPIDLDKPLFPRGRKALEKAVTDKSSDMEALLFGLDIESRSYELYRKAAAGIVEPLGKAMFEFLAGEERRHFDILMMRYDFLFGPIGWSA